MAGNKGGDAKGIGGGTGGDQPEELVKRRAAIDDLDGRVAVAYLGPEGTFSEMAVQRHFGRDVDGVPCNSIDEIFRATETGTAQYGVLPVENSTEGAIGRTMDLLVTSPLKICGEVVLK